MKYLALVLAALLAGCAAVNIQLPAQQASATCGLVASDTRPDPSTLVFKKLLQIEPMATTPSASESVRQSVCAAMPTAPAARFVLTDFDCSATGFWDIRFVVDLRGRLERTGQQTIEVRANKVLESHDANYRTMCQEAGAAVVSAAARDVAQALQNLGDIAGQALR